MSWITAQINADEEEEFDKLLAFSEYIASFINFEAVKNIQNQRANRKTTGDEDFADLIEKISGRPAPDFRKDD